MGSVFRVICSLTVLYLLIVTNILPRFTFLYLLLAIHYSAHARLKKSVCFLLQKCSEVVLFATRNRRNRRAFWTNPEFRNYLQSYAR